MNQLKHVFLFSSWPAWQTGTCWGTHLAMPKSGIATRLRQTARRPTVAGPSTATTPARVGPRGGAPRTKTELQTMARDLGRSIEGANDALRARIRAALERQRGAGAKSSSASAHAPRRSDSPEPTPAAAASAPPGPSKATGAGPGTPAASTHGSLEYLTVMRDLLQLSQGSPDAAAMLAPVVQGMPMQQRGRPSAEAHPTHTPPPGAPSAPVPVAPMDMHWETVIGAEVCRAGADGLVGMGSAENIPARVSEGAAEGSGPRSCGGRGQVRAEGLRASRRPGLASRAPLVARRT